MLKPHNAHFTKESKGNRFQSFVRRSISYLPSSDRVLDFANAAAKGGYVTNPYLAAGLVGANAIRRNRERLGSGSGYAVAGLAGAAAVPAIYKRIQQLRGRK